MARGGRLKSGLVIPGHVTSVKPPARVCMVIVGQNDDGSSRLCGMKFTEDEMLDYQRHVTRCAKVHHAEIQAASKRVRMPGFYGPEAADAEAESWVRRNRQKIIEGRLSFYGKRRRHDGGRKRR